MNENKQSPNDHPQDDEDLASILSNATLPEKGDDIPVDDDDMAQHPTDAVAAEPTIPKATNETLREFEKRLQETMGEPGGSFGLMVPDFDAVNNHKSNED